MRMECMFCHKPYKEEEYEVCGRKGTIPVPQCDCEAKELKRQEEAEKERARQRLVEALGLPPKLRPFTLDNIECEHRAEARLFVEGFKPHRKGLFLWGANGNGKTTLAAVICKELAYRGRRVLFTTMSSILNKMEEGGIGRAANVKRLLRELQTYDFVVFDDYGREDYTPARLQNVFLILNTLYEWQVTFCMTANPECINRIKNIPELAAIKDRLSEVLINWKFSNPSFRRAK